MMVLACGYWALIKQLKINESLKKNYTLWVRLAVYLIFLQNTLTDRLRLASFSFLQKIKDLPT